MHRGWLATGLVLVTLAVWPTLAVGQAQTEGNEQAETAAVAAVIKESGESGGSARQESAAAKAADQAKVVLFRLAGEVPELATDVSLLSPRRPTTMERWIRRLAQARNDAGVKAVVLEIGEVDLGWAQVQEFRTAIGRLRKAGKPVYGYLSDGDLKSYVVAASCDQVVIAPAGHLMVPGLFLQVWFYKDLMAKIGVQADILHIGDYKGAGEPYTRSEPSEEFKAQMNRLTDDMYKQILEQIAESRDLESEQVEKIVNTGLFNANEAVQAQLADRTMHLEDLLSDLEGKHGATVDREYGRKSREKPDLSSPFAIFKMFGQAAQKQKSKKPAVGLILLTGMIVDSNENSLFDGTVSPKDIQEAVKEAMDDENVKAVVLRIDSPGGSALASDVMYSHIRQLADSKPLVVSMGNVAASGGYYVAAAGPVIMAEPGTITGSIGVLGGKVVVRDLLEKIGIRTYTIQRGEMANVFDMTTDFTPVQREHVHKLMKSIYGVFLDRVMQTRRDKLARPLDDIAGGRVYTGREAKALGLVDKLGGLTEAVYLAAEKAGVKDYEIRVIPKPKNFMEMVLEDMFRDADAEARALSQYAGAVLPTGSDRTSRAIRRAIGQALLRIRLLRNEPVLLVLPFDLNQVP